MKHFIFLLISMNFLVAWGQVGIGTTNPQGSLDVVSINNLGMVIPRVSKIEDVTNGQGSPAVNGSVVYDLFRRKVCFRIDGKWVCTGADSGSSGGSTIEVTQPLDCSSFTYLKPDVTQNNDYFGRLKFAMNTEGTILAVGNSIEDSNATGINGDASNDLATDSGAVYIFVNNSGTWQQEAYIKASNTEADDLFGHGIALNDAGDKLAVGAPAEDSNATGFNGDQTDNSVHNAGAVYLFEKNAGVWSQTGYLKPDFHDASSFGQGNHIGYDLDFNADGTILAVSASRDDSPAPGVNNDPTAYGSFDAGAAYIFYESGGVWLQEAYIKPNIVGSQDRFGYPIVLNDDGDRVIIGANDEDSAATGINGDATDNSLNKSGAVYVFSKTGGVWSQEAYIKAHNPTDWDYFGNSLTGNGDLSVFVVGAIAEASNATGVNGDGSDNSLGYSGACYIFRKVAGNWVQEAYIKAAYPRNGHFSRETDMNKEGTLLAVGSPYDDSNGSCLTGDPSNTSSTQSGAVYLFGYANEEWTQLSYIKAPNAESDDQFGGGLGLSGNGKVLFMGAGREDCLDNSQTNNGTKVGAVYILEW